MTTTLLAYIPSPSQGVWHLFGVPLRAYALCIILGIVAALILGDRRWTARGGQPGVVYDIALWAVPFGLVGGRLYHVITDWPTYFGETGLGFVAALRIWDGGLGIWGAVALGAVGAWIGCRQRDIPLAAFGDAIAPGIILAQAIGRLGNFFNQELYGRSTTMPWGLEVYERLNTAGVPDSLNGVSTGQLLDVVHPTFLYELLWNLLVFAVLIYVDRRFTVGHGRLFALYVGGYCLGRFWIELMRSDTATLIAGIRVNTFTSMFVFIGAVVYIMVAPKGREDPATLAGKSEGADEDSKVEELPKDLAAVGATSGIVAAAKAAGEADDEDAAAVGDDGPAETETAIADSDVAVAEAVVSADPDALTEVAEPPLSEAAAENEQLAEDVAVAPAEEIFEAEEFAAAGEEADVDESEFEAKPDAGLGAVEGDEAVEAQEAAAEVHEAEADAVAEAEAGEPDAGPDESTGSPKSGSGTESDASASHNSDLAAKPDPTQADKPDAGLGAVEGDEAVEVQEAAAEVHEAEVAAVAEAEAGEPDAAPDSSTGSPKSGSGTESDASASHNSDLAAKAEPTQADTPDPGLGTVEGDEAVEAQEAAAEVHEAEADAVAEGEKTTDSDDEANEPPPVAAPVDKPAAGGRLGRLLRGRKRS